MKGIFLLKIVVNTRLSFIMLVKRGGVNCSGITEDASAAVGSLGGETSITSSEITRLVFEYMSNLGRGVVAGMFFISIMVADKWRTLNTVSASLSC